MLGAASFIRATPLRRASLAAALWLATAAAATPQALPDGIAGLKFGSTVAQVTAKLPSMQPMSTATPAPGSMPVMYYRAENQSFEGLTPCVASLGFVADKLYEARFDCGRDAKIATVLRERFGTPNEEDPQFSVWQSERTQLSLNRTVMTFTLGDRGLTQAVHQLIIQKALSGGGVPAPTSEPVAPSR